MNTESTDQPSEGPSGPECLGNIPVLIVDCQGDGNRLVEIAWSVGSVSGGWPTARRFLVRQEGALSSMFQRLTGISETDLAEARGPEEVAAALLTDLSRSRLVVAHSSRYEARLLRGLPGVTEALPPGGFTCTAELARRLLPGLSGFGLRAVCGYLCLPLEERRSAPLHVAATARIWCELLGAVGEARATIPGLRAILESRPPEPPRRLVRLPEGWRESLPDRPGIYRLRDFAGKDLYIGKAASLRKRVPQHFHSASWRSKNGMSSAICDVAVEICETELEAALLEARLIEEAGPACNKALSAPPPAVAWFSRDLARTSPTRGRGYSLGPHPAQGAIHDLRILCDALSAGEGGIVRESCRWLGSFEPGSFSDGFDLFRAAHADCSSGDPASLLRLASEIEVQPEDTDGEAGEEPGPARVLRALESLVAAAGSAGRRAEWYGLLACSVLGWEAPGGTREIALCAGEVKGAGWAAGDGRLPEHAPGCPGAGSIGPSALRRMSLITGEVRKLLRRKGDIRIIPVRASKALDRDRIVELLGRF